MSSIRFTRSARSWLECLPLGDGRLGVMTDGGVSRTTLHLNDATAWSGSPRSETAHGVPGAEECATLLAETRRLIAEGDPIGAETPLKRMQTAYAQSFMPFGKVVIDVAGAADTLSRELDLATGIHRASSDDLRTTTFLTDEHSVLVHVIEPAVPAQVILRSQLRGADPDSIEAAVISVDSDTCALRVRLPSDVAPGHEPDLPGAAWGPDALQGAIVARRIQHADRTVVLVATATTFTGLGAPPRGTADDALADALGRIASAATIDVDVLRDASGSAMRATLGPVGLSLGDAPESAAADTAERLATARADARGVIAADPDLVATLFDYGRYLLVSASRAGSLPANLQGLWNAELRPPWGSGYTLNINTQMNYWGAQVTGLAAHAEPLTDFTLALAEAAEPHTARLYGASGWTVHHNSDPWLYSTPVGRGAGDPRWAHWPMGGAWLASLLTEAWEFGAAGTPHLERIWPTLRGAAAFVLDWHHDGVTSPATSPENAYVSNGGTASLAATSAMDLALIGMVLERVVRTAQALQVDDPIVEAAAARLRSIPTQPAVSEGRIVEWDAAHEEEDPQHRHVSHLFGLYPGREPWDADHRAAATETLVRRGDDSTGWSLMWKLALWARLERADKVADLLALVFRDAASTGRQWSGGLYPNLFAAHPPFQIDGNLGFVGALAEALVQSHDGIHLLPAVPDALGTGRVTGLVARPGISVGIEWRDGLLLSATLRARTSSASGEHAVRWQHRTITVAIDTERDTVLDAASFA